MDLAEFQQLVREGELDCAANGPHYQRTVAAQALIGHAWALGLPIAGLLLIGLAIPLRSVLVLLLGLALLAIALPLLLRRPMAPAGEVLRREQAPDFFAALDHLRSTLGAPALHEVRLTDRFELSAHAIPSWGLYGPRQYGLVVGLPLLMALERRRALALLVHEYAHLRERGLAPAIYRLRQNWQGLYRALAQSTHPLTWPVRRFLAWYLPRFMARSFALAREEAFEGDRIARKLLSAEVLIAALKELEIKSAWLEEEYWPAHWKGALENEHPQGPMRTLRRALAEEAPERFARDALDKAWRRRSGPDDPLPVLHDRLEALLDGAKVERSIPVYSKNAASQMLGKSLQPLRERFDLRWCRAQSKAWTAQRELLLRLRARLAQLQEPDERLDAKHATELAELSLRLDPQADAIELYRRVLEIDRDHSGGLRGMAQAAREIDARASLACAEQLYRLYPEHRLWAARLAVQLLDKEPASSEPVRLWKARLQEVATIEHQSVIELNQGDWYEYTHPSDLSESERLALVLSLRREEAVAAAWIASKALRNADWRRCHVLVLDLPGMDSAAASACCQQLVAALPLPGLCRIGALQLGQDPEGSGALQALDLLRV